MSEDGRASEVDLWAHLVRGVAGQTANYFLGASFFYQ